MILSALYKYYERVAGTPDGPPVHGYSVEKVVGAVHLDADGRFLGLVDLRETDAKGKARPRLLSVPCPPQRTVAVAAGFLCDNAGYLCGVDRKGRPERALAQFQAARDLHERLLDGVDDGAARAVLGFFRTWTPESATEALAQWDDLLDGWLVFMVEGTDTPYAHDISALREAWLARLEAGGSKRRGQCLVSGLSDEPIARLHPAIKGVRGAQSSGASLVSFNIDAATSYGKDQSFNAPVAERVAFGYSAALNHLLRRENGRSRTIGDTTFVFWAEQQTEAENWFAELLDPQDAVPWTEEGGETDAEKLTAVKVRDTLRCLAKGQPTPFPELEHDRDVVFHVLGLSPNAARLSVRLWVTATLGELLSRIGAHQRDLALEADQPWRPAHPSLWALAYETRPKDDKGKARGEGSAEALNKLHGDLLRAVLTGGPYPAALLPVLLARFRSDGWITHPRVALVKAALTRQWRLHKTPKKELEMSLDESRGEAGYLLGRLFAVLERLQQAAHGTGLNTTIRDKFGASASATPRTVFPHLLQLSQAHLKKARRDAKGFAYKLERMQGEIADRLSDIPATLDGENQALFFLGYYQQRQALWRKADRADTAPETVETP